MKTLTLTPEQTNELNRIKAVYLLSRGKTAREIAELLMFDEDRIGNYRKRYEQGGLKRLLKDNYTGSEPMLSCSELAELSDDKLATLLMRNFQIVNTVAAR